MPGVTSPAEEYFKNGQWGWNGSTWRKLAMVWGYSDVWRERKSNTNADAGNNSLTHTEVSTGEVWVVQNIAVVNTITAVTYVRIYVSYSGGTLVLGEFSSPAANTWDFWTGGMALKAGEKILVTFAGCAAGDDIYSDALGYKMKVSE